MMLFKSTAGRVVCVLYTQVLFFSSLICMGLVLVVASIVSISKNYWTCAVLNIYYTDAWLCLTIGIAQLLLGIGIGVVIYLQPKCVKKDRLVLVGPEGNQLGEIAADRVQSTTNRDCMLRISTSHQKSHSPCRPQRTRCHWFCCCSNGDCNQSVFAHWFRPTAVIFFLLLAAHIVAISLTASLISQAYSSDSGLNSEVATIFIEAKSFLLYNDLPISSSATAKCWERLESYRYCCGSEGPEDWLTDHPSNTTLLNIPFEMMKQHCACSRIETGICENRSFEVSPSVFRNALIYSRGCKEVAFADIIHDLRVLRILVPVSFCVILFTCILSVCVTLRVAYLELDNKENSTPSQSIEDHSQMYASHTILQPCPRSSVAGLDPPNPSHSPNPLSNVTGPALRSLSIDGPLYQQFSTSQL